MRDLGRHRVKHHCSLLSLAPMTFDANTFSCYSGSYFVTIAVVFIIFQRPLNLVVPSMPTSSSLFITAIIAYLFRVYSFAEWSSAFIITAPEGTAVIHTNTSIIFCQSYITRAWGMPALFVHLFYMVTHLLDGRVLPVPFFSKGLLYTVSLFLSLTTPFLVKEMFMDFGYTYAPNLSHQRASLITEIPSAHGNKNSASSNRNEVIHGTELIS
jgi:hypothetical protein